jgi:phosphatidate phosphatase APP1
MNNIKNQLVKAARKAHQKLDEIKSNWKKANALLRIVPYRGYVSENHLFMEGRVLEDETIFVDKTDSQIRDLLNSFKRFESDEVPGIEVVVTFNHQEIHTRTDEEGYYTIDEALAHPLPDNMPTSVTAQVTLPGLPDTLDDDIHESAELMFADRTSEFGIITDVDDTILQTHVTSLFYLRMIATTLLDNAHQRLPMEGIKEVIWKMVKGSDNLRNNPVFYVSNSPWNLYDVLDDFMDLQGLPKGPILLRDVGFLSKYSNPRNTKIERISHILKTYPNLPFIMLGDTASDDADVYTEMSNRFPDQLKAFYIRQTKDNKNARRIQQLIQNNPHITGKVVFSSAEILEDAHQRGFIL